MPRHSIDELAEGRAVSTVLVLGGSGQLGREFQRTLPSNWRVIAPSRAQVDIESITSLRAAMRDHAPAMVLNAAAYTAVDRAEEEPARATAVNAAGAEHVATVARESGARLLHISTDFVFDGSGGRPYGPGDPAHPLGIYGATKLEGERRVRAILGDDAVIVRTAWLYSAQGVNFVHTMLGLLGSRAEVTVITDEVGTPTWARSLAQGLWRIAARPDVRGIHHWTDAGVASWYDFAEAIREEALALGLLQKAATVRPIRSAEYPRAAPRPSYSVLAKEHTWEAVQMVPPHWRSNLRLMLGELARG
jgi:dTDP-4-dehydrorhamnose reductase